MERDQTQISAFVSTATRDEVERYSREHGVKKGALLEQALLHHLLALRELPSDIVVPPRLVLDPASGRKVMRRLKRPRKPTAFMKKLMARAPD